MADTTGTALALAEDKLPLTREQGLELLESMSGMWTGQFEGDGGAEGFVRWLRGENQTG